MEKKVHAYLKRGVGIEMHYKQKCWQLHLMLVFTYEPLGNHDFWETVALFCFGFFLKRKGFISHVRFCFCVKFINEYKHY